MTTASRAGSRAPLAPGGLPLAGHALRLLRNPMSFLHSLRPLGDVVRIRLGPLPVHVLTAPEVVHEVLVTQGRNFQRGRFFDRIGLVAGQDLAGDGPAVQLRQRRMIQPAFHPDRMAGYAAIVAELAEATAQSWQAGQEIELHDAMFRLSVSTLAKALFTADAGAHAVAELRRAMPVVLRQVAWLALSPLPATLPTPGNRRLRVATTRLRSAVDQLADRYRTSGRDHGDLASMLLTSQDEDGETMSPAQIYSSIVFLMIAGTHTTALTLSSLFDELGRNPGHESRVHEEIDRVLGGRPAQYADLPALEYTSRVLTETLRLHTPVRVLMRRTLRPTTLAGIDLPADAEVLYSPHALHRDPRYFRDPLRFDPDRWLPGRADHLPRGAFAPFSIGRNRCVGESFAWMEAMLIAVTIASRWRLQPVPARTVLESASAVPRPPVLPMVLRSR